MFAQSNGKIRKPMPKGDNEHEDQYHQDVYKAVTQVLQGLNKGISYGNGTNTDENQNLDGYHSGPVLTPGAPGTQFTVNHTLGRVPYGYHLIFADQNGTLIASGVWTATQVFFKWSVGVTTIKIFLF